MGLSSGLLFRVIMSDYLLRVIELGYHVGLSCGVIVMGYFRDYCVWLSCEIILLGYRLGLSLG